MNRLLPVLTLLVILTASPAAAQWAVFDSANTAKNEAIARIRETALTTVRQATTLLTKMEQRLAVVRNMRDYAIARAARWAMGHVKGPLEHGRAPFAVYSAFMRALDEGGRVVHAISGPHVDDADPVDAVFRTALTTLDATDGVLASSVDLTGRVRELSARNEHAFAALESDAATTSGAATAALDALAAASLLRAHQKQVRNELLTGLNEHLLVENLRARQTDATAVRMRAGMAAYAEALTTARHDAGIDAFTTWRQP